MKSIFYKIRGNVVYSVEKSYVDNLEAWKFLDLIFWELHRNF